jgi:hypothetical protein
MKVARVSQVELDGPVGTLYTIVQSSGSRCSTVRCRSWLAGWNGDKSWRGGPGTKACPGAQVESCHVSFICKWSWVCMCSTQTLRSHITWHLSTCTFGEITPI